MHAAPLAGFSAMARTGVIIGVIGERIPAPLGIAQAGRKGVAEVRSRGEMIAPAERRYDYARGPAKPGSRRRCWRSIRPWRLKMRSCAPVRLLVSTGCGGPAPPYFWRPMRTACLNPFAMRSGGWMRVSSHRRGIQRRRWSATGGSCRSVFEAGATRSLRAWHRFPAVGMAGPKSSRWRHLVQRASPRLSGGAEKW